MGTKVVLQMRRVLQVSGNRGERERSLLRMKEEESDEGGSEQTVNGLIYLPISFVFII